MLDPLSITIPFPKTSSSPLPVLPTRKLLQPSPSYPDDYILELDNSSLELVQTCLRASENYLIRSREVSSESSATAFGGLFHSCEELRLRHGLSDAVRQKQHELIAQHFLSHPPRPDDHRTAERMIQILKLYNARYENDGWPERVLRDEADEPFIERPFKIELCTIPINGRLPYDRYTLLSRPWPKDIADVGTEEVAVRNLHVLYTGRIDLALSDSNLLWIADHKTSSIGGRQYYEDFRLSSQTIGYTWAAQKLLGAAVAGLILNAVIIRPPTKTGTAHEFNRVSYFYRPDQLAEWENDVKANISLFVSHLLSGYFPKQTKWCQNKYGTCQYFENCCLPPQQRPVDLASDLYRDVTWNPVHATK